MGGNFSLARTSHHINAMRGSSTAAQVATGAAIVVAAIIATMVLPLGSWIDHLVTWTRHAGWLGLAGFALAFVGLARTPGQQALVWAGVAATVAVSILIGWIAKRALTRAAR
jgi:hypothetical protein